MSRLGLKTDFQDGNILYGAELNTNNRATMAAVNDNYDRIVGLDETKANTDYLESQLALKADKIAVEASLNLKADTTYVNTELAKKLNDAEFRSFAASIEDSKANKTEVEAALNLKANLEYVNTQLDTKLSDEEFRSFSASVSDNFNMKADKEDTYTKQEVDTIIDDIPVPEINVATIDKTGVVKPDGVTVTVDEEGTLSSTGSSEVYIGDEEPTLDSVKLWIDPDGLVAGAATVDNLGLVKPDGETITIDDDGTIHSVGGSGTGGSYDDTELRNLINTKADKTYVDERDEIVANSITDTVELMVENGVVTWEDITDKPTIPINTSDLTNDSNFVDTTQMNEAIATAITGALESDY